MKMTKQVFLTDFFLITNFHVLKLRLTLIKLSGGGILIGIKIKKERTAFVDLVALCES